jgi:hypothetical protein
MKLNDLENKNVAARALKENFALDFDVSRLDKTTAKVMHKKVSTLIRESKKSANFYKTQNSPSYMKAVFMEQALAKHINNFKPSRIVLENEEVDKSQVILAAQDMVDSVQKMYEDVNDMLVKELPALVDSIQSEIGANESDQFNQQVSQSLTSLNTTLLQTRQTLQSALNAMTGQGGPGFGDEMGGNMAGMDAGDEMGGDMAGMDAGAGDEMGGDEMAGMDAGAGDEMGSDEMAGLPPAPEEEPETPTGSVGRSKR